MKYARWAPEDNASVIGQDYTTADEQTGQTSLGMTSMA